MPIALYPSVVMNNDLSPDHGGSDVDEACEIIHNATKGWGANKQKVIDALATKDQEKRYYIAIRYKELYGKDLVDLMKKEFSGDFGEALQFLALPADQAECRMIKLATKGIGSSVNIIWSILLGRTNAEIDRLKKTYFSMYSKDLGKLLASELHGTMERLVFTAMQGNEEAYDPQYHTLEKAREDAEIIHSKGAGRWGTEERGIFKIICASPREHLENISLAYAEKYGYTLIKAMEKELNGLGEKDVQEATMHLIYLKLKPYEAMAHLIKAACAGIGTDEMLLTCTIIRYQGVMQGVMSAHVELFGKTIHERVRKEVRGNYRELLLQVLNTVWPEQG